MRLKNIVKYNISEMKNSILIFYAIVIAILALLLFSYSNMHGDVSISGADLGTVIFLFILGLNSFKQNYLFLITNGVSRKAQFYGFILASLPIAAVLAAIDTLISNLLPQFVNYNSMFDQVYRRFDGNTDAILVLVNFIWSMAIYLFFIFLGHLITTLYYRMSKLLKIIVSIGVPGLFLYLLPIVDNEFNDGRFYHWVGQMFFSIMGLRNVSSPLLAVASFLEAAAVLAALTYLLVRRAPVKE